MCLFNITQSILRKIRQAQVAGGQVFGFKPCCQVWKIFGSEVGLKTNPTSLYNSQLNTLTSEGLFFFSSPYLVLITGKNTYCTCFPASRFAATLYLYFGAALCIESFKKLCYTHSGLDACCNVKGLSCSDLPTENYLSVVPRSPVERF